MRAERGTVENVKKEIEKERKVGVVIELEGVEGARLYLISAEVSIEQKVQQAGSVVKP